MYPPTEVSYKGLENQGATCYLNSVLQVLYMTKDFREALKRYTCDNPECIDNQLKTLFDKLSERTTTTYGITEKLGITRVYEQQDAAEYFEKILNLTSAEASQVFHGMLTQRTTCSTCSKQSETDGPFWHLPLALVDSCSEYCVVKGIEEFFTVLTLSGDNQLYCDQCDDKRDATIQSVMKKHPEVLMLLLKKFEFNYYTMAYIKMNHTVRVPCMLQIPENQTYELYAYVEHFGDLGSGHYTATIKTDETQKDTWYNFNDTKVTLAPSPFQVEDIQSSKSAYLLFYKRKNEQAVDTSTTAISEEEFSPGLDQCKAAFMVGKEKKVEVFIKDRVFDHPGVEVPSPEPCYKEQLVNVIQRLSISAQQHRTKRVKNLQVENERKAKKVKVPSKRQAARKRLAGRKIRKSCWYLFHSKETARIKKKLVRCKIRLQSQKNNVL